MNAQRLTEIRYGCGHTDAVDLLKVAGRRRKAIAHRMALTGECSRCASRRLQERAVSWLAAQDTKDRADVAAFESLHDLPRLIGGAEAEEWGRRSRHRLLKVALEAADPSLLALSKTVTDAWWWRGHSEMPPTSLLAAPQSRPASTSKEPTTSTRKETAMIKIYASDTCVKCGPTKRAFDKKGVSYEVVEVDNNPKVQALLRAQGHHELPVVVTPHETWTGFRPDKILTAAAQFHADPAAGLSTGPEVA
jgi:glutaredoxin-like protein NrdH